MDKIRQLLENKWGSFSNDVYYEKQLNLAVYSPRTFLNVLFKPVSIEAYIQVEEVLGCKLHPELRQLFKDYNGMMLFSQSMRIYGISLAEANAYPYKTMDMVRENIVLNATCPRWNKNMIAFGFYGPFQFCYHKNNPDKIYVIDRNTLETFHVFRSIKELLNYYVERLLKEYDQNGMKIHKDPNKKESWLRNISTEAL